MQAIPVLEAGLLTYAEDDGGKLGQAYRLAYDLEAETATLRSSYATPLVLRLCG